MDEEKPYLLQFFRYEHLPMYLQAVSMRFSDVASLIATYPQNEERDMALRKLLEAKDCAVRSMLINQERK